MSAFLAGFDVLAAGTIVGALLLSALFIRFALDDRLGKEVERRRREAAEAAAAEARADVDGAIRPGDAAARPREASPDPAPDEPRRPRRAA